MWVKSNFFLWQTGYYNLLTEKKDSKIHVFEVLLFFVNVMWLSISRNSLQALYLDDKLLGNFTLPNLIILVEDLIRWKRGIDVFWLITMMVILKIKISLVSYKKLLYQYHPPYTRRVSSHRVLHLEFLGLYSICVIYLHNNRCPFKSYYCYVLFLAIRKILQILRKIFLIQSLYTLEKKIPP